MGKNISQEIPYGFKESTGGAKPSCCPARYILGRVKGMCDNCPMRKTVSRACDCYGLPYIDITDHPYRIVNKGSGEKMFLCYPYHVYLDDMKLLVEYCDVHGLEVEACNVHSNHGAIHDDGHVGTAVCLWFYKKREGVTHTRSSKIIGK